jgi:tetratricopeptide (TPR) repeat protein
MFRRFRDEKDWETARRMLFFIKADNLDGLKSGYDYYRAQIGLTLFRQKSYAEAVKMYDEAFAANPKCDRDDDYNVCAICCAQTGDVNKALAMYYKALKLKPDSPVILCNKGNLLYDQKRYDEALPCYTLALEIEESASRYNWRGACYKAIGMNDKANADYAKAKTLGG